MINSLSQVQEMLLRQAAKEEDLIFKSRYMMSTPGCSREKVLKLKSSYPSTPASYLSVISNYNLNEVEIDSFSLSPYGTGNDDLIDSFINAQLDAFFPREFMDKNRMYQIGSYNTDILCVTAGTSQYHEGEILYIDEGFDIYNPEDSQIRPIAKDFEQFLIVAGNLEELHTEMQGDDSLYEQKLQEFLARLATIRVDEKYYPAWKRVF